MGNCSNFDKRPGSPESFSSVSSEPPLEQLNPLRRTPPANHSKEEEKQEKQENKIKTIYYTEFKKQCPST